MPSMPAALYVLFGATLLLAVGRLVLHLGQLSIRRLSFRQRLTRLREELAEAGPANRAKMLVARAHLPWPWATIWLDGSAHGVTVPDRKRSPFMTLQFGDGMPTPIRGLVCDEKGIGGMLSFDGEPSRIWVPWEAVYAIGSSVRKAQWSWAQDMKPESRSRVSTASYGKRLRCPGCDRAPFGDTWVCEGCGTQMDPFLTGALCSSCGHTDRAGTQCPGCRDRFPIQDWTADA